MPKNNRRSRRHGHFLAAWIRSPFTMGSVIPSSRALAKAMAAQLELKAPGMIVELGAGTGAVTQVLADAVPKERLLVIEREPALYDVLVAHFPDHDVICADAAYLDGVLAERDIKQVNAIVSSLPLLSMPKAIRHAIEQRLLSAVAHGGKIVQFTYGPRSPISKAAQRQHGISGAKVKTVLNNVPPAHVWVYKKI